ncbi:MAG: hypothetical protein WBZ36_01260 [Candidatus Nitrosopolaris sp.]
MVDWKQSLPQIIAAAIGSGLLVSAFSTISSLIFRPIVDISVDPPDKNVANMAYTISVENIGYAPATHLRLTMSYPGVKNIRTIVNHEEENMTLKNESEGTAVVAFLPRLTPHGMVSINASIYRNNPVLNESKKPVQNAPPLADYSDNIKDYAYSHYQPYSIIATYDQGSNQFNPSPFQVSSKAIYPYSGLETEVLKSLILIALAFLSFGVAFRHKRRSRSKLASDILTDIMMVRHELTNNERDHPSGLVISLHPWGSDIDYERKIVGYYRDYHKIDDFYSTVRSRNHHLLRKEINTDELKNLNKGCIKKANTAKDEIKWRKFHKLDLVLLICNSSWNFVYGYCRRNFRGLVYGYWNPGRLSNSLWNNLPSYRHQLHRFSSTKESLI